MLLSNEEMEVLNRASEILSKYVSVGSISQKVFSTFESMIISIIDNMPNEEINDKEFDSPDSFFSFASYLDGVAITHYIGFDDKTICIPQTIEGKRVLALGNKAFYKVDHIISVIIPEGIISIGDNCFDSCTKLERVSIPKSLKAIGYRAFAETAIKDLEVPNSVFYMGNYAFAATPIRKMVLSPSLYEISEHAFWRCKQLQQVFIPEGIKRISNGAFSDCSALSYLSLPNGLVEIGQQAFFNCFQLNELEVPSTVEKIESHAFDGGEWGNVYNRRDIKILCVQGSYAQQYAREKNYGIKKTRINYAATYYEGIPVYHIRENNQERMNSLVNLLIQKHYNWIRTGDYDIHLCTKNEETVRILSFRHSIYKMGMQICLKE